MRRLIAFHIVWVGAAASICGITLLRGTTWQALIHGLVLQHLGFADRFYMAAPLFAFTAPLAVVVCAALSWRLRTADACVSESIVRWSRLGMMALLVGVGLRYLSDASAPVEHGLDDRGHAGLLMSLVTPFAWLLLVPREGRRRSDQQYFGRLMLVCTAVLQPLIAYPTPGTQMAAGSLPLLLIVLICVRDSVAGATVCNSAFARLVRGGFATAAVLITVVVVFHQQAAYHRAEPLNLAGAMRLRMVSPRARQTRALVSALRENADTFVSLHNGYNSLYLWAGIEPPTGLNATFWPWMLSHDQQDRVVRVLQRTDRVCCIEKILPGRVEPPVTPLGTFLQKQGRPLGTIGFWKLWRLAR